VLTGGWLFRCAIAGFLIFVLAACGYRDMMPAIDRAKLRITLQRTACFGTCPDYLVTIDGYGNVVFQTRPPIEGGAAEVHQMMSPDSGVLFPGRHVDKIPQEIVDNLVDQFRGAGFFSLKKEYVAQITDSPTYVLTLDTGHGRKSVVDYVGKEIGMPVSVTNLQEAVDRAAGTARWVVGTKSLLPWLEAQQFDFHSDKAATIAILGAGRDAEDGMLVGMIDRGLPLSKQLRVGDRDFGIVGVAMMKSAIENGLPQTFGRLAKLGFLDQMSRETAGQIFADSAAGCSPEIVEIAAREGVAIDMAGSVTKSFEEYETKGDSALRALSSSYNCDDESRRVATARSLLEHGADPNRRNILGETAIFGVENPELLDLLYARGADGRVQDQAGNSAVFSTWTDEIVLRHLQHGASPVGRYDYDGNTLREQMRERPMPKVAQWLDEQARAKR
jgi:hypothetical protein